MHMVYLLQTYNVRSDISDISDNAQSTAFSHKVNTQAIHASHTLVCDHSSLGR